jgi:hydroxyethylthiazole kinase-like uncharacterized protein yjeF
MFIFSKINPENNMPGGIRSGHMGKETDVKAAGVKTAGCPIRNIDDILDKRGSELVKRDINANKGTYGRLLIIAGSKGMAGAAYLCGLAAFKTGVGMVKYLGPEENRVILQTLLPEAMYESIAYTEDRFSGQVSNISDCLSWADALILGPGLSKSDEARNLIRQIFTAENADIIKGLRLTVIDADALNIIAEERLDLSILTGGSHSNVVITPHAAEMARLVNAFSGKNAVNVTDIKNDPEGYAADFSMRFNVTVVLKDAKTTIAEAALRPEIIRIDSGSPAMAKAGSGDVLCGFIAGVSAVLLWDLKDSVPLAVYMHGRAGSVAAQKKGVNSILARDIAEYANEAFLSASAGKEA